MPETSAALRDKPLPGPPPSSKSHRATTQPRHAISPRGLQDSIHNIARKNPNITPTNSSNNSPRDTITTTSTTSNNRNNNNAHGGKPRRDPGFDQRARELHQRMSDASARSLVSSTSGADTIINMSRDDSNNRAVGSGTIRSSMNGRDDQPSPPPAATALSASSSRRRRSTMRHSNLSPNPSYLAKLEALRANTQQQLGSAYPMSLSLSPAPLSSSAASPGASPPSTFDSQPASPALLGQFHELQRQIQSLRARNASLSAENATLLAAGRAREAALDDLRGQLRAKDAEHAALVEQFCVETSQRDDEVGRTRESLSALKEEKMKLLDRVAELEQQQQDQTHQHPPHHPHQAQASQRRQMPVLIDCCGSYSLSSPAPSTYRGSESHSESGGHWASSSPVVRSSSNNTPSVYTPISSRHGGDPAGACLYTTVTPSPSIRIHWRRRRSSLAGSQVTTVSQFEEELSALSEQLAVHYERYSQEYQALTAQLAVLAEDKAQLEKDLVVAREQQVAVAGRNRDLESRLASQGPLVQSASMAPIPELPVLTYDKLGSVWFDRVTSSFKYWGLFEFISQPDAAVTSPSDPDRESRRLRAAVILKRAIEDDILDDLIYLESQRSITTSSNTSSQSTSSSPQAAYIPQLESPYFLYQTIATLKRTVPTSLMDYNWLDRIVDSDFEDIEGFASLVLCLDRRHSKLYGTSVDHYDALVPKIQENMSKRFPDLERPLVDLAPTPTPKKWWHLSLWMSKIVKRRQGKVADDS